MSGGMDRCKGREENRQNITPPLPICLWGGLRGVGCVLQDEEKKRASCSWGLGGRDWNGKRAAIILCCWLVPLYFPAPATDDCLLQPVAWWCVQISRLVYLNMLYGSLFLGLIAGSHVCMFKCPNPYRVATINFHVEPTPGTFGLGGKAAVWVNNCLQIISLDYEA